MQLVDLVPTILARLGLPRPGGLEGRAIGQGRDAMFAQGGEAAAVIVGDLKYVEHANGDAEIFDLDGDPGELRNLVGEQPREAAALHARLRAWQLTRRMVAVDLAGPPEPRLPRALGYVR